MNFSPGQKLFRSALWLLAALLVLAHLPARAALEERWLLVFDTSWTMKKRLPGVEAAVKKLLATSAGGQLHPGDTVGVWTFGQQLKPGEFPLVTWAPEDSAETISNLVAFVHKHRYAGETNLLVLQPTLGRVIQDSARLTIVIFCDGQGQVNWTPFNDGINETFQQNLAERKDARQPFVLLLRTQFGKFVGCTINFPPGDITLPSFPPPPEVKAVPAIPPPPVAPVVPVVPKPLPPTVPALVIVGTTVGTNPAALPPAAPATNAAPVLAKPPVPAVTNPLPPTGINPPVEKKPIEKISPPPVIAPASNAPEKITPAINPPASNAPPAPAVTDGGSANWLLLGGGALAAVLVIILVARSRRPRNSLITDSLNAPKFPPRKK